MQYTNLGFACGLFLITLGFPLDCSVSENRISFEDEPKNESDDQEHPSSFPWGHTGMDEHWRLSNLIADIDQALRTLQQFRGYRRITAHNVLENDTRKKIFSIICSNPGIDMTRLAVLSDCNERTLRYHIDQIVEKNYITIYSPGKSFHFFENHNAFSLREQKFLSYYSSGQTGKILSLIHQKPGITRREIADYLGVASPTVTRMVQVLKQEECVKLVKEGKYTRHYLVSDLISIIQRMIPT